MLAASAVGDTLISGLLEGEDVLATAQALRLLGARIENISDGAWRVTGRGVGVAGAVTSSRSRQCRDRCASSYGACCVSSVQQRILRGCLSVRSSHGTRDGTATPHGREFYSPVGWVAAIDGAWMDMLVPLEETLSVASAQVKSAILLAGLNTRGKTTVIEPAPSRDHTENMLAHFGAEVTVQDTVAGRAITLTGYPELLAKDIQVPADISSAAFPLVAGLLCTGGVTIENVSLNPLRTGLLDCLRDMGATIKISNGTDQWRRGHRRCFRRP